MNDFELLQVLGIVGRASRHHQANSAKFWEEVQAELNELQKLADELKEARGR